MLYYHIGFVLLVIFYLQLIQMRYFLVKKVGDLYLLLHWKNKQVIQLDSLKCHNNQYFNVLK